MWSASCSLSLQVRKENSADGDQMRKSSNRKGSLSPLPTRQQMVDKIIPNTILHQNSLLKRKGVALQTFSFNQIKKFCLIGVERFLFDVFALSSRAKVLLKISRLIFKPKLLIVQLCYLPQFRRIHMSLQIVIVQIAMCQAICCIVYCCLSINFVVLLKSQLLMLTTWLFSFGSSKFGVLSFRYNCVFFKPQCFILIVTSHGRVLNSFFFGNVTSNNLQNLLLEPFEELFIFPLESF